MTADAHPRGRRRHAPAGLGAAAACEPRVSPSTSPSTAPTASGGRRESAYDAIVLDIMLPGMNGYRVCATLRETGNWTPILMLTAKDGEHDEAEALDTGADDFLSKPFSFVVLVARLRALLRRGGRSGPTVAHRRRPPPRPGGAPVLAGRRRDRADAARVRRCSSTSCGGRARSCPKAEILDHVWDFDFDGDPNIVEVYIGHLRRKIDEPFGRHAIETVRLVGYRLDPDGG